MPRYVWDKYDVKLVESETTYKWDDSLPALETELASAFFITMIDGSPKVLCSIEHLPGDYQEVDANAYFAAEEGTEITYKTHPYIKHTLTEPNEWEDPDEYVKIKTCELASPSSPLIAETEVSEEGTPKYTITYDYYRKIITYKYEKGDNHLGIVSFDSDDEYPENGYKDFNDPPLPITPQPDQNAPENVFWFIYKGTDNCDPTIRYNTTNVPESGGTIIAEIVPSSAISYPIEQPLYSWYTNTDGDHWELYMADSLITKLPFIIPDGFTSFTVGIILSDGLGYRSEIIQGEMIKPSIEVAPPVPILSVPDSVIVNKSYTVSWELPTVIRDENAVTFELERRLDSGSYTTIYNGSDLSYNDIQYGDHTTVQYRIRSVGINGLKSTYDTSEIIQISANHPPLISGENKNLGLITEFNESYIITDTDSDTLSAVEYLDDKPTKTIDSVTPGQTYQIQITGGEWNKLSDSIHIVKVVATDVNGASSQRSWVFRKNSGSSEDVDQEFYRVYQKQKDGSYKLFRFENVTENVYHHDFRLDSVLDRTLPEVRPTNDLPEDISEGKIIIGNDKVWVGGANGTVIELTKQKGGHVAQSTPPADTNLLWIDTSNTSAPLLRFYNNGKWDYIKSVYSGGTIG